MQFYSVIPQQQQKNVLQQYMYYMREFYYNSQNYEKITIGTNGSNLFIFKKFSFNTP